MALGVGDEEFCSVAELVERIKDILSRQPSFKGRLVFDSDVAALLGITKVNLATIKRRNKMPFREVVSFGIRCGYDPRELLKKSKDNC